MLFVLLLGVGVLLIGHVMRAPWQARFIMLALLYVVVLFEQIALPDGNPLREMTGGSPELWLIVGAALAAVLGYVWLLQKLRGRASALEAERAPPEVSEQAPIFGDDELERYARHITLPEIGGSGQVRLKNSRVLVVGAGGLGAPALLYLGAAGVGTIGVIDDDVVELSNLQRQVIHTDNRQGMPKVFSAQAAIREINPFVEVRPYHRRLTRDIAETLFAEYDLIIDGSDSFATRKLVNEAAAAAGRPVMAGAISAWEGQITLYDPGAGAPCFSCLFPDEPAAGQAQTCSETGVIGALPGVIGSMLALEAVKELAGAGEGLRGRLLIYDALHAENRAMQIAPSSSCRICADMQPARGTVSVKSAAPLSGVQGAKA